MYALRNGNIFLFDCFLLCACVCVPCPRSRPYRHVRLVLARMALASRIRVDEGVRDDIEEPPLRFHVVSMESCEFMLYVLFYDKVFYLRLHVFVTALYDGNYSHIQVVSGAIVVDSRNYIYLCAQCRLNQSTSATRFRLPF